MQWSTKCKKTSRFGNVIVDLLHAMFSDYANLQARHDAPRTTLEAYNVPEVQWEPLGHAAGGLGKWKVFAVIGAVVVRELRAKRSVIVNCIYAAFREIVASFLTHVVEIKFGKEAKIEVATNKKLDYTLLPIVNIWSVAYIELPFCAKSY